MSAVTGGLVEMQPLIRRAGAGPGLTPSAHGKPCYPEEPDAGIGSATWPWAGALARGPSPKILTSLAWPRASGGLKVPSGLRCCGMASGQSQAEPTGLQDRGPRVLTAPTR